MEERPVYAYIPKNLNLTGGILGGPVDTRRAIEALIGAGIAVLIYKGLSVYIHSPNLLYVCALLGLCLVAAGLVGGNGEPFSVFIFNFLNYERRRFFVTLRPPMPDFEEEKKAASKGSGTEERLLAAFRKGRSRKKGGSRS